MELDVIYNEDCLKGLKELPDHTVDLIVTDPPYLISATNGGGTVGEEVEQVPSRPENS